MTINTSSPEWLAIAKLMRERIEAHKEQCCSIHATAETRAACAARVDELRHILMLTEGAAQRPRPTASKSETY